MSKESLEWLNNNTLIGFTDKRGHAWHWREDLQGDEPNHYPGAIPVPDIERRLFAWSAVERPIFTETADGSKVFAIEDRKAIVRDDDDHVLGIFKDGYRPHQYRDWLLRTVETILDDTLQPASAGLLRHGAQAWVQVEVPDNIVTPSGVAFRPSLVAYTSFDGSLATGYKRVGTAIVCDNTFALALGERKQSFRIKHTTNSMHRIAEAREALEIVFETGDLMSAQIENLIATEVKVEEWNRVLDKLVPVPEAEGRGRTQAQNKRGKLIDLYTHDDRVMPWKDTAYGVVQAFNTYNQHVGNVRGMSRVQRNFASMLDGTTARQDSEVLAALGVAA